jgi:preprotein translocase SecE subunit
MGEMRSEGGAAARRRQRAERAAAARPQPAQQPQPAQERKRSNFIAESWAELKKVEWPGQSQVIQGTVVVLIACLVVGTYLYLNDQVWKNVVSKILLGQ